MLKKDCISMSVFGYENREKNSVYISKNAFKRNVDLLLIEEEGKGNYVHFKDFNVLMYNQILHHDRKYFC